MNLTELINSGTNITVTVTPQDLKTFAGDIARELAAVKPPSQKKEEKYLTADQVCELLSISRVTLWHWDRKEITTPYKIGNLKRYKLSDIETFMNEQK